MNRLLPLLPLLILVTLLELASRQGWIAPYLFPAPSEIAGTLFAETQGALLKATAETFRAAGLGFLASICLGILGGVALSSARWIELIFYPYAVFFQTVPIIAIAPLLVIWFGYGLPTVFSASLIVSVFPMIAATLSGIRGTDSALRDLFRLYRASRARTLFGLLLPSALPSILTGARISAGLAVIGAIVGEFIAGGGLGGMIDASVTLQRLDLVFACVLLSAALGWVFFAGVGLTSRTLLGQWHFSELNPQRRTDP